MPIDKEIFRAFWLPRTFDNICKGKRGLFLFISASFFSLFPIACFLAAQSDGTLYLRHINKGRGLMEHPAFWALFLSGPTFLFLLSLLCQRMGVVLDKFCFAAPDKTGPAYECRAKVTNLLTCRTPPLKVAFGVMVLVGFLSLLANYQNTRQPYAVFGHDVWDSVYHHRGFIVAKACLAFAWLYLFPLMIYVALAASISLVMIVQSLAINRSIDFSPFEADGCGGYRPLGQVMLVVIYLNIPFTLVLAGDIYAHQNFYFTIASAVFLQALILAFEIFLPFMKLHRLLDAGKKARLQELGSLLAKEENSIRTGEKSDDLSSAKMLAILAAVELYKQTHKMQTWPYLPIDRFKWLTPFLPIVLGLLRKVASP